jgi:HPt (histidine-containing phosphotransfer) domain-containing protein
VTGSPDESTDGWDDALRVLAGRAHMRNRVRAQRIAELLSAPWERDTAVREEAAHLCHTVAGSAATFGEPGLADACLLLETALREGRDHDVMPALDVLRSRASGARSPEA